MSFTFSVVSLPCNHIPSPVNTMCTMDPYQHIPLRVIIEEVVETSLEGVKQLIIWDLMSGTLDSRVVHATTM